MAAKRGFYTFICFFTIIILLFFNNQLIFPQDPVYPASDDIEEISFDYNSIVEHAPGSDNWAITWAGNGHQYTTWGDGGGFGGTDDSGRVSLGFGRVEGTHNNYTGFNIWGGYNPENPAEFEGKSYGIICINDTLWMWRTGDGSDETAYDLQELYISTNYGATWVYADVRFNNIDFNGFPKFYAVAFCQFGQNYSGARDNFVYMYAPETFNLTWDVQYPGRISLMKAPVAELNNKSSYLFFAGLDSSGSPVWTSDLHERKPAFEDSLNGAMRVSVIYNPGLQRYLLITQQVSRWQAQNGHIGIYEASEPWGPWHTVLFENAWDIDLQHGNKTVFWNFSGKWFRDEGKKFTMVMTGDGPDNWGTIDGEFLTALPVELNNFSSSVHGNNVTLSWSTSSELNNYVFEIQRAEVIDNLLAEYITIGVVEGNGTTSVYSNYTFEDKNLKPGIYWYRLKQKDFDGSVKHYYHNSEVIINGEINFLLEQNFPNPFNPETKINFKLPGSGNLKLIIYNSLGEIIRVLSDSHLSAGSHFLNWDGKDFNGINASSGIYFYKIIFTPEDVSENKFSQVKKMLLVR